MTIPEKSRWLLPRLQLGKKQAFRSFQIITWLRILRNMAVILLLLVTVACFRVDVGVLALGGALLLTVLRAAEEEQVIHDLPWSTILMVCGMTTLMAILEKTGGIELFTQVLVRLSTPRTAPIRWSSRPGTAARPRC